MTTTDIDADPSHGRAVGQETQVIRILIADDHPLIRDGLRAGLSDEEDLVVCGCAEDGESAVEMSRALEPDVILMDLTMPRLDGLSALRTILEENPEMRVLVVSAYGDRAHVRTALDAGAAGYVLKGTTTEELGVALRAVHRGETVLSPDELTDLAL